MGTYQLITDLNFQLPPEWMLKNFDLNTMRFMIETHLIPNPAGVITEAFREIAPGEKNSPKFLIGMVVGTGAQDFEVEDISLGHGVWFNLTEIDRFDWIPPGRGNMIYPKGVGTFSTTGMIRTDRMNIDFMFLSAWTKFQDGAHDEYFATMQIHKIPLYHETIPGRPIFFNSRLDADNLDNTQFILLKLAYFVGKYKTI